MLTYVIFTNGNVTNYSPTVTYNNVTSTTTVSATGASATPGLSIEIQFYSVRNPPSELTTASFGITIKRTNYIMEQLNTGSTPVKFKARRGSITGTVTVSTLEVGATADYTFNVQLSNPISSSANSLVIIYLPTLFAASVTGSSSCLPACQSLTSTAATFLASTITALTSSSLSFTVKLLSLSNPYQIGATTSFIINSQLYSAYT